jgi:HAD superfamily hydrolase (TIGR01509 family)
MVFDLDGTLVQTERLKALSYARAAVELCPHTLHEEDVVKAFGEVVGLSRQEVATYLVQRFDLREKAQERMDKFGVRAPWQAFVQVRLHHYERMIADPEVLRANRWPHNVALLEAARRTGCRTALATMSRCEQAQRVLEALELTEAFDFVATRDDVEHGKPDPEIYQLVARELIVPPGECLVIEDSPSGVKSALGARMWCIAVTTPFTRDSIRAQHLLDPRWIADDPASLVEAVNDMFSLREGDRRV